MKPSNFPGRFEYLAANPHIASRTKDTTAIEVALEGAVDGALTSVARYHQERLDAAGKLQQLDDEWARRGRRAPDDGRQPLVEEVDAAKAAEDAARAALSKATSELNAIGSASRGVERYIADRVRQDRDVSRDSQPKGPGLLVSIIGDRTSHTGETAAAVKYRELKVITPKLKGDLLAIIKKARDDIREFGEDLQVVLNAPPAFEEALASVNAQLEALTSQAPVSVGFASGRPNVRFPLEALHEAESRAPGVIPSVIDVRPLMMMVAGDRIRETVEAAVREHYEGIEVAPDRENRRTLIADLKASLLEAERIECAAIWAAREAGHDVMFRPDADPRAVLGVEGPAPTKSRDD